MYRRYHAQHAAKRAAEREKFDQERAEILRLAPITTEPAPQPAKPTAAVSQQLRQQPQHRR